MKILFGKIKVGDKFKFGKYVFTKLSPHRHKRYEYVNAIGEKFCMYTGDTGHRYFYDDQIVTVN